MKALFIFGLLTLASANYDHSKFVKKEAGFGVLKNPPSFEGRLEGGQNALDTMYPYAAELQVRWRTGRSDVCTGSLLSTTFIITARECLFDDNLGQSSATVMVHLGSASRVGQRVSIFIQWATWLDRVDGLGPHPNFGLAQLSQAVTLTPTIQPVRLPTLSQSTQWFSGLSAFIAGWGETTQGTFSNNLQHGRVIIAPPEINRPDLVPGITEYELSADRGSENPNLRLAYGDSGGPLAIDESGTHTLIGVLWANRQIGQTADLLITAFRVGHFWDFIHDEAGIERRF